MATERTITVKAADGQLTMAELQAFLAEFDSATAQTPGPDVAAVIALKPKARVSFGGRLKSVTVTIPAAP